ncbi:MAG: hypothetical protein LUH13_03905 [Oscillospiraceae bacterium]|nr:hypothetical protein [Oscillospiraceae bacterium]
MTKKSRTVKYEVSRALALFLTAAMLLSQILLADSVSSAAEGELSESIYPITSAAELAAFADEVNAGSDYSGQTVSLSRDIDIGNVISDISEAAGFAVAAPVVSGTYSSASVDTGSGWSYACSFSGSFGSNSSFQAGNIYTATATILADTESDYYFDTEDNMTLPDGWTLLSWSRAAISLRRAYSLEEANAARYTDTTGNQSVALGSYSYYIFLREGTTRSDPGIVSALVTLSSDGTLAVTLPVEDEETETVACTLTDSGTIRVELMDNNDVSGSLEGTEITLIDPDFPNGVSGVLDAYNVVYFSVTDADGVGTVYATVPYLNENGSISRSKATAETAYTVAVADGGRNPVAAAAVTMDSAGIVVCLPESIAAADCAPLTVTVLDPDGQAAEGMTVTLYAPDFTAGTAAAADADGSVTFALTDETGAAGSRDYTIAVTSGADNAAVAGALTAASASAVGVCSFRLSVQRRDRRLCRLFQRQRHYGCRRDELCELCGRVQSGRRFHLFRRRGAARRGRHHRLCLSRDIQQPDRNLQLRQSRRTDWLGGFVLWRVLRRHRGSCGQRNAGHVLLQRGRHRNDRHRTRGRHRRLLRSGAGNQLSYQPVLQQRRYYRHTDCGQHGLLLCRRSARL